MYIPLNWEFGSVLAKLWNFGGFNPPTPPLSTPLGPFFQWLIFDARWNLFPIQAATWNLCLRRIPAACFTLISIAVSEEFFKIKA
jgi:hypothetical protein